MKALDILESFKRAAGCSEAFIGYSNRKNIYEAIAELEALENRSCESCKYYLSDNGNYPLEPCCECSRFYSDKWDSK